VLGNPPYVSTHTSSEEAWRTINRLGLSPELRKCLATTKLIESMHSGVEGRTGRVTRRQDRDMALRWAAAAAPEAEQNCRKIIGHEDLWMLSAVLDGDRLRFPTNRRESQNPVDNGRVAA